MLPRVTFPLHSRSQTESSGIASAMFTSTFMHTRRFSPQSKALAFIKEYWIKGAFIKQVRLQGVLKNQTLWYLVVLD